MTTLEIIVGILLVVMGLFLVVSVLMQSSKDHRLSGSIAGGAETFFGKTKGKTIDATLNRLTMYVTIIFVVLVLILYFVQPPFDPYAPAEVTTEIPEVTDVAEDADVVAEDAEAVVDDAEAVAEEAEAEVEG